jgi:PPM family protein phosphatase
MIHFATRTHPGRVHEDNEDAVGVDEARKIWFVADGMGGHAGGEVASGIVRETILRSVDLSLPDAVAAAHRAVVAAASADDRLTGMGSTVVALGLHGDQAEVVWVGDSRSYLWRAGTLKRVSRDHSMMEMLRDAGELSEAQVQTHPQRHVVTQTLGHGEPVASSVRVELRGNDWMILCSDGLHDELDDAELSTLLEESETPDDAVVRLVDAALAKGGRDNISVVVIRFSYDDLGIRQRRWPRLRRFVVAQRWAPALLGIAVALLLGLLVLLMLRIR